MTGVCPRGQMASAGSQARSGSSTAFVAPNRDWLDVVIDLVPGGEAAGFVEGTRGFVGAGVRDGGNLHAGGFHLVHNSGDTVLDTAMPKRS